MEKNHYWIGDVFICDGKAWGLTKNCQTVIVGTVKDGQVTPLSNAQPIETPAGDTLDTPLQLSVSKNCPICGSVVKGKRIDRRYCSHKCRQIANRGKQLQLAGVN